MKKKVKQFQFNKITDYSILNPLKEEWRKSLTAPQDDMWETFTDYSNHWELKDDTQIIGYACVNEDNRLLQYFVLPNWLQESEMVFQQFIRQQKIDNALIGTNNPIFLSTAMHFQKLVKVDTYLFSNFLNENIIVKEGTLRLAKSKDLIRSVDYYHKSIGAPKEWLNGYVGNLIDRGEFFLFEDGEEILGSCEVRKSKSNTEVANVGMAVSPEHRKKGLGTFLLGKAKEIAIQWDKKPICSCEKDNIGSIKSIQNNGFRSLHQMLLMEF